MNGRITGTGVRRRALIWVTNAAPFGTSGLKRQPSGLPGCLILLFEKKGNSKQKEMGI
jgi:hypothetical protein